MFGDAFIPGSKFLYTTDTGNHALSLCQVNLHNDIVTLLRRNGHA